MRKTTSGFTIVELLIVIVVIAILAAISIVAYNGVQDRAYSTAIQSDLSNSSKKIQLIYAETGAYPVGGAQIASDGASATGAYAAGPTPSIGVVVSKSSYLEATGSGVANYTYCTGIGLSSGKAEYAITGQTKSLKIFQYSSMRGAELLGTTSFSYSSVICSGIGWPRSVSYGYFTNSGGWQSWVNG